MYQSFMTILCRCAPLLQQNTFNLLYFSSSAASHEKCIVKRSYKTLCGTLLVLIREHQTNRYNSGHDDQHDELNLN